MFFVPCLISYLSHKSQEYHNEVRKEIIQYISQTLPDLHNYSLNKEVLTLLYEPTRQMGNTGRHSSSY